MSIVVAGIDVSKADLNIHLNGQDRNVPNNRDGFRALGKWFRKAKVDRVVVEATGRYHRALHQSRKRVNGDV